MISLLAKWLIPNRDKVENSEVRRAWGSLCGFMGIVLNLLLFAGKLAAGALSGSIAVTADAFNNLSDAGSSVVTLLGFRLAGKKPDADHPFGHGRMEYVSGLAVAGLILLMGAELAKSSVEKILRPESVSFSWLAAAILLVSIGVKVYMYLYNKAVGKKIRSAAMAATASDSLSDAAATAAVLLAMLVGHWSGVQLDGWTGLLVALFILWSAVQAARDTVSPLLGQSPDPLLVKEIEELVMAHDAVVGVHDLVVHDYGPGRRIISLHAEVPADGQVLALHDVIDNIEAELSRKLHCEAVIHMDPVVVGDPQVDALHEKVAALVRTIDPRITIHDFRIVPGATHTNLIFDAVIPFDERLTRPQVAAQICQLVQGLDGRYRAVVKIENSYVSE